jgi:hypothetical protein
MEFNEAYLVAILNRFRPSRHFNYIDETLVQAFEGYELCSLKLKP